MGILTVTLLLFLVYRVYMKMRSIIETKYKKGDSNGMATCDQLDGSTPIDR